MLSPVLVKILSGENFVLSRVSKKWLLLISKKEWETPVKDLQFEQGKSLKSKTKRCKKK
ncbi:hypothetical protein PORCRE_67 [Porphyromonas crevioricanis JCM 15906]|uniref:Uncharacterized protein n=1 Tax=Porphyromonas crevioricanis JCM 15906 TaxID=1305617 RepID=S4N6K1_9PORP|nr:hypothetical protein PORCRE_67 [Porphyromonas crevioricanis JCM 15906]